MRAAFSGSTNVSSLRRSTSILWKGPVHRSLGPTHRADRYGTIKVVLSTDVPSPTISV